MTVNRNGRIKDLFWIKVHVAGDNDSYLCNNDTELGEFQKLDKEK